MIPFIEELLPITDFFTKVLRSHRLWEAWDLQIAVFGVRPVGCVAHGKGFVSQRLEIGRIQEKRERCVSKVNLCKTELCNGCRMAKRDGRD